MRHAPVTYAAPSPGARRALVVLFAVAVSLFGGVATAARAAVVHEFLPGPTKGISEAALSCHGPGSVTGPLGQVNALTVSPGETVSELGHLWLAEEKETQSGERVDEFSASTGSCEQQLEHPSSLERLNTIRGVAVGHHTGEREVYVGFGSAGSQGVAVFGPLGELQHVWTGADTPDGSFQSSGGGEANVTGVAVDESKSPGDWASGDVLVATVGRHGGVVDVLPALAGGSEPPAGGVHQLLGVCNVGAVCAPGASGFEAFKRLNAVAVDQANGEVFVVNGLREVDMFMPVGLGGEYEFVGHLAPPGGFAGQALGVVVDGGAVDGGDVFVWEAGAVDEFALAGGGLLERLTGVGASVFAHVSSVAVDPVSHHVFVGDDRGEEGGVVDVFGEDLVVPDVRVAAASGVTASTAVLNGTVNPLSAETHEGAACEFEYGTSTAYGLHAACEPPGVGEGNSPAPVHSLQLSALAPDTTYFYRLAATNGKGTNRGVCPEDCGRFTTRGPGVGVASAALVTATSVSLRASIDPNSAPTSYRFEYDTRPYVVGEGGHGTSVPVPDQSIGSAQGAQQVRQHVQSLTPGTVYHYRVVAQSEVEPGKVEDFDGSDSTFTTQGVAAVGLADGRGWEMVSPPLKQGALIVSIDAPGAPGEGDVIQAATDGGAFAYVTDGPTEPQPQGSTNGTQVFSTRTPTGWQTRDLTLPHLAATDASVGPGNEYRFFSEDLSSAIVQPFGQFDPAISPEASEASAFSHSDYLNGNPLQACVGGCYRPLVTGKEGFANVPPGTRFGLGFVNGALQPCPPVLICGPRFLGASSDARHVVLSSDVALTETAPADTLYEWDSAAGTLRLVSVLPEDEGGAPAGGATLGYAGDARNAVSGDGSRVFFTTGGGGLYMRDVAAGRTIRLDAAQAGCLALETCGKGNAGAQFQDASADGSRVWFTDTQRLTAGAGATPGKPDLYECAITLEAAGEPVCALSDLGAAGGVVGASVDGSYVYVSTPAGVFLHHYDSEPGHEGWEAPRLIAPGADGLNFTSLDNMTARVSPNGRWLVFMSAVSLTGYDNLDARSGHPDEEVYLYDAATARVACVSCNPTGARPIGGEYGYAGEKMPVVGGHQIWENNTWLAALVPGWTPFHLGTARYQSRYLSDSGRVFFDARDPLVAGAVNENWDVYQWEPPGVGSCTEAAAAFSVRSGGCVSLVSSGESPDESAFLDASATGGDVFFMSTAKLSKKDVDNSYDVYDAHECTGASPCLPAAAEPPPPCTTADSCRPAPSPQPEVFGTPSSATFTGPGNLTPEAPAIVKPKPETKAQKLAKALKACHKDRKKKKRQACERAAHKAFGARASRRGRADARAGSPSSVWSFGYDR